MDGDGVPVGGSSGGRGAVVYLLWGASWTMVKLKSNICGGLDGVYRAQRGCGVGGGTKNGE